MFNKRALVKPLAVKVVIDDTKHNHNPSNQHAIIHILRSGRCCGGPEAPEEDKEDIDARESIIDDAKDAWNPPGAPDQRWLHHFVLRVLDCEAEDPCELCFFILGIERAEGFDLSRTAPPQEQRAWDEVGCIKSRSRKRNEVFESSG